jgi:hypothetical protein
MIIKERRELNTPVLIPLHLIVMTIVECDAINNGKYYVDADSNQLLPIPLTAEHLETLGYLDENGESAYDVGDVMDLRKYHANCDTKFDKIKDNKIYVTVTD